MKTASAWRAANSLPSSDEPGLHQQRVALGRARRVERAVDREVLALDLVDLARVGVQAAHAGAHDGVGQLFSSRYT
ncbi:hypothetical protein ACIBF7_34215 [Nonomuraea sp. NPDC050478]|uniref:hypothetical protein n=1 Tax=Nonomuraea sp. NPDC050478 TaxID=3364365 RepID=UPI003799003E